MRAVVLDIGGVLELTPPTGHREGWERRLGLAPGELDARLAELWYAGGVGRITEAEVGAGIAERLGLDEVQLAEFVEGLWAEYLGSPNTELIDWFAGLRPRWRTGILSNSFVGATEREEERYGLAALTDVLVYSHEVGLEKPDPAVYRLVCERLGVRPEEAVFVDDRPPAVDGAVAVGMAGVLHTDNARTIAAVERLLA